MKVDYGAVALIPKGEFNATEQYAVNDLVSYNGSSFIVKAVPPVGTLPTNTAYFTINASGTSPATSSTVGTVKPDNSTIEVDNNGVISVKSTVLDRVSSSEQALTVNLLNPTSPSGTLSGITVVRNADNSYTISGTNTSESTITVALALIASVGFENGKTYRALGCPSNTPDGVYIRVGAQIKENGEGANFSYPVQSGQQIFISIVAGTVIETPITIKPMITTNLSATYDDYIPYSGSSGKLDTDYKALSDKIGNVGNTDLQSQLNAATQSIAQNTTDIAANAAGISALNTGLATKTGSLIPNVISLNNYSWISVKQTGNVVNVQFILQNNGVAFDIQQFNPCTITGVDLPRDSDVLIIGNAYSSHDAFSCEHACYAVIGNDGKIYIKVSTANELWVHVSFTYIV